MIGLAMPEQAVDRRLELLRAERLREVGVRAGGHSGGDVLGLVAAGEEHHERVGELRSRAKAARHLHAVEPGHLDVEQRDPWPDLQREREGLVASRRGDDVEAGALETRGDHRHDGDRIVRDENRLVSGGVHGGRA